MNRLAFGGNAERLGKSQARVERHGTRQVLAEQDDLRSAKHQRRGESIRFSERREAV